MSHPFTAELHDMLLRVAGWLPDDALTYSRAALADDRCVEVARVLAFSGRRTVLPLDDDDLDALAELLESEGEDPAVLEAMELIPPSTTLLWRFAPDWGATPEGGDGSSEDGTMLISALAEQDLLAEVVRVPGIRGLWSAVRRPIGDEPHPEPRVVYVAEVDDDADDAGEPAELAARLQEILLAAGERDPQVEIVSIHGARNRYQRAVQSAGKLLWSPHEDLQLNVARVFDEVDADSGPRFAPDHAKIADDDERARLVEYLDSGTELLVTTGTLGDIVDPARGRVVPMNFRTDGSWIWTDTVTYYLRTHQLAPEAELLRHLRGVGGPPQPLDTVTLSRALAALRPAKEAEPVWSASQS
ncbi:hypothetical protein [Amycolatopsis sp. lyj-23]|uniref:hypothetical protein n=1 Tax=Amycolatopsis sp. lyj-23 TaxID=2789283 RepID=UPI003979885A